MGIFRFEGKFQRRFQVDHDVELKDSNVDLLYIIIFGRVWPTLHHHINEVIIDETVNFVLTIILFV